MYHGQVVPGFPQHPHRGFETVTVARRGFIDHSDSLGAAARYGQGDVQWLTAGAGIVHAEMFPLLERSLPNPVELFQIWLNLPAARKMAQPHFSMLWRDTIPEVALEGARVRVVAGALEGRSAPRPPPSSWASSPEADLAIWTLTLAAGEGCTLPPARPGTNRTLYFFRGHGLALEGRAVPLMHGVRVRGDASVRLVAGPAEAEVLVLQGRPIGEPVAQHGPFVMNSRAQLVQAFTDYQRTGFGGWPWPGGDPVHPREAGRFARHPDGRHERPG
jgi:redox-sensitive bicupin YhaK (pirin superfamily)